MKGLDMATHENYETRAIMCCQVSLMFGLHLARSIFCHQQPSLSIYYKPIEAIYTIFNYAELRKVYTIYIIDLDYL